MSQITEMMIIVSFCLKQDETFLVTTEGRDILRSTNVKCSAIGLIILRGGAHYSLQKKFSCSIQGHTMSQTSTLGCGVHL